MSHPTSQSDARALLGWYAENARPLPWRDASQKKDPYRIWLSEIMLQQTTVQAVIPYFERFLRQFPTVASLAEAPLEKVLELWSGLGYYSRARLLHRSAQDLAKSGFPKSYRELIELPGFGPYTARAVSSIAFGEKVGIVDGNSIRVLSRKYGRSVEWWTPKGRAVIQELADDLARHGDSSFLNQGLMDLGATVCTPTSPKCLLCPWVKNCVARQDDLVETLPLAKPRKKTEIWIWRPVIVTRPKKGKASSIEVAMVENDYAPFLKGQWFWPGKAEKKKTAPKKFAYTHSVTHHRIFVIPEFGKAGRIPRSARWIASTDVRQVNPASLLSKALAFALKEDS